MSLINIKMKRDLQGVERVETVERPQERWRDAKDASNEKMEEENLQSLIQRRAGSVRGELGNFG